jgi:uncharacterized protein
MPIEKALHPGSQVYYPIRFIAVLAAILFFSRDLISWPPRHAWASVAVGLAVFVVWVAPDQLSHYRHSPLFENALTGAAVSSIGPELRRTWWFIALRVAGSALTVPIAEELFWRGWLMRWLIDQEFWRVPLGKYVPSAFWTVAVFFAAEHGPYWDVGLAAGVIYNWWMVRTRSLADCILAHAVTNAALAAWVLTQGQWEYWL